MLRTFRTLSRFTPTLAIPFFDTRSEHDRNLIGHMEENLDTGSDRLKKMFSRSEFNEVSVELHSVIQTTLTGAFIGACMGGLVQSRHAYLYFIENNQATIFNTTLDAKKKLQDYMTVAFVKGAVHWGWRLAFFSGTFGLISTMISVYRDESSIIEYIVAGFITGGLYKANLGLAASVVGACLGASLSLIGGSIILGILKLSGVRMEDIRRALYTIKETRVYHYKQVEEKSARVKHDDVTRHHDMLVEKKGETKIEEL